MKEPTSIQVNAEFTRLFGGDTAIIAGLMATNGNQWVTPKEISEVTWFSNPKIYRCVNGLLADKIPLGIFDKSILIIDGKVRTVYRLTDSAYDFSKKKAKK